jgi:heme exporter protein D
MKEYEKVAIVLIFLVAAVLFCETAHERKERLQKEKEWRERKASLDKALVEGDYQTAENLLLQFLDEQKVKNLEVVLQALEKIKDVKVYWNIITLLSEKEDVYDEEAKKNYFQAFTNYLITSKNSKISFDLLYVFYWRSKLDLLSYVRRIVGKGSTGQKIFALEILKKFLGKKILKLLITLRFKKFPTVPQDEEKHALYFAIRKLIYEITGGKVDFDSLEEWKRYLRNKKNWRELGKKREVAGPAILKEHGKFSTIAGGNRKILVVRGPYDYKLPEVLQEMGIAHEVVASFNDIDKKLLSNVDVIFVACGASLPSEPSDFSTGGDKKPSLPDKAKKETIHSLLRDFVANGGYLFAEDLGISKVIEKLFPGYISSGSSNQPGEYPIYPHKGFSVHPLFIDVFIEPPTGGNSPLKWVADLPPVYQINYDEAKVQPIIFSPTFEGNNIMGVTFFYPGRGNEGRAFLQKGYENPFFAKGGRVLYLTSHFGKQPKTGSGFALQQLVLNFVYEARLRKLKYVFLPESKKGKK